MSNNKRADLVVYGKIFTSENNQLAEAFAVKDGKFVYVGDKNGAETFIEAGKTQVLDYTGKGLVMPACGNGHAHYSIGVALPMVGTVVSGKTTPEEFLKEVVPAAVKKARETEATSVFGFGWNYITFMDNMPTRQQLDAICSDIPIYFARRNCDGARRHPYRFPERTGRYVRAFLPGHRAPLPPGCG